MRIVLLNSVGIPDTVIDNRDISRHCEYILLNDVLYKKEDNSIASFRQIPTNHFQIIIDE